MTARVLAMIGDMDACALWRVLLPFSELQRQGYPWIEWGPQDDRLALIAHRFDAVVIPRQHWESGDLDKAAHFFRSLHRAGLAAIYEVDDDMFTAGFIKRLVDHHGYTPERSRERQDLIIRAMQACDGVTVSSQRLATIVRQFTDKPVRVVPNYIDLRWFKKVQKGAGRDRRLTGLTIGWAGGNRPDKDVETMAVAWGRIATRYPGVTFVIQGHHAKVFYENVPNERIAMIDWMPIESYPAGLLNIDIGCCPLSDLPFNRSKTYIKAMEYAASGAAVVASPTVYSQLIETGKDGFIVDSVDEWETALSALVESYDLRKQISKALLAKVRREHSLEANAWRWVEAWTEIVADYRNRQRNKILIPQGVEYA